MAQKRMFDKAIIDMDRFMDLPISAKALYFLLGMESDDEGFVSYKKVMRIHGGSEDDIKVLIAKHFVIQFENGVVVITDWNKNNYLDKRRIRPTEYQNERKMLKITDTLEYELQDPAKPPLSRRLESIEQDSIEQNRIVQSSIDIGDKSLSPKQEAKYFFDETDHQLEIINFLTDKGIPQAIAEREIKNFIDYWTEPNSTGTKQRWELEKTFEIKRRLAKWFNNYAKWNKQPNLEKKGVSV